MANRALHWEGIRDIRVDRIRQSPAGRLLGTTTSTTDAQQLLAHGDIALQAAHGIDPSIGGLVPQLGLGRIRIHGLKTPCYGASGGLKELREELDAENEGIQALSQIRWLRSAGAKAIYRERWTCDRTPIAAGAAGVLGALPLPGPQVR